MASVTIDNTGLTDGRIKTIGLLLEISKFDARGRIIEVWAHCTEHQIYALTPAMIDGIAELKGFAKAMVESELGVVEADGRIRVKGTQGRIEWLGECRSQSQPGGKVRAQTAQRNEKGQFLPAAPALDQHAGEQRNSTLSPIDCAPLLEGLHPSSTPAPIQHAGESLDQHRHPATPARSSPSSTSSSSAISNSKSSSSPSSLLLYGDAAQKFVDNSETRVDNSAPAAGKPQELSTHLPPEGAQKLTTGPPNLEGIPDSDRVTIVSLNEELMKRRAKI